VDIQTVGGYGPHVASPQSDSLTELARQHGVSRESLLEFVRSKIQETQEANGQPTVDRDTLEEAISQTLDHDRDQPADGAPADADEPTTLTSYTSAARSVTERGPVANSISILA
jgi:transposase-like protein